MACISFINCRLSLRLSLALSQLATHVTSGWVQLPQQPLKLLIMPWRLPQSFLCPLCNLLLFCWPVAVHASSSSTAVSSPRLTLRKSNPATFAVGCCLIFSATKSCCKFNLIFSTLCLKFPIGNGKLRLPKFHLTCS